MLCGALCGLCVAVLVYQADDLSGLSPSRELTNIAKSRGPDILDLWVVDLQKEVKRTNFHNHREIVYNKICPLMDRLKNLEEKAKVSGEKRQRFLVSVLRVYDKVLGFSLDHNVVGCLYDYYMTSSPDELFKLSKDVLSPHNTQVLKNGLKTYETEFNEGSG